MLVGARWLIEQGAGSRAKIGAAIAQMLGEAAPR
jgi:hypothetical protein